MRVLLAVALVGAALLLRGRGAAPLSGGDATACKLSDPTASGDGDTCGLTSNCWWWNRAKTRRTDTYNDSYDRYYEVKHGKKRGEADQSGVCFSAMQEVTGSKGIDNLDMRTSWFPEAGDPAPSSNSTLTWVLVGAGALVLVLVILLLVL